MNIVLKLLTYSNMGVLSCGHSTHKWYPTPQPSMKFKKCSYEVEGGKVCKCHTSQKVDRLEFGFLRQALVASRQNATFNYCVVRVFGAISREPLVVKRDPFISKDSVENS